MSSDPTFIQRVRYAARSFAIHITPFKWWGHYAIEPFFTQHRVQIGPVRLEYWHLPTNAELEAEAEKRK